MSLSTSHRSGEVSYDGKNLYTVHGAATAVNGTQRFGHFVAPCDGVIVAAGINVDITPTNATNDLSLGLISDIDSTFDEIDITDFAVQYHDLMGQTQGVGGLNVTRGEQYAWGWVGADTTGHLSTVLVIQPRGTA